MDSNALRIYIPIICFRQECGLWKYVQERAEKTVETYSVVRSLPICGELVCGGWIFKCDR